MTECGAANTMLLIVLKLMSVTPSLFHCRPIRPGLVLFIKPQSHQAYDQVTTYMRPKNGPIVERTYDWSRRSYDWSQRSWMIARGKSVAARS